MAESEFCYAPAQAVDEIEDLLDIDAALILSDKVIGQIYRLAGIFAERLIELDYLKQYPGLIGIDHHFDVGKPSTYVTFLAAHNPRFLQPKQMFGLWSVVKKTAWPDIITDQARRREYYEIKPLNGNGTYKGTKKLAEISSFMGGFRLPYVMGTSYSPTPRLEIGKGKILTNPATRIPITFTLALKVERTAPGLLQYKYCIKLDVGSLAESVILYILAALAAFFALRAIRVGPGEWEGPGPSWDPVTSPAFTKVGRVVFTSMLA